MKGIDLNKYPFEVNYEENDGLRFYHVTFRDFPYVDGAGDTIEEALEMGKEALRLSIEEMAKSGKKIPEPSLRRMDDVTGRVTLRMPKTLHRKLVERSEEDGVSLNTSIVVALSEYLTESQRKSAPERITDYSKTNIFHSTNSGFLNEGFDEYEKTSKFGLPRKLAKATA